MRTKAPAPGPRPRAASKAPWHTGSYIRPEKVTAAALPAQPSPFAVLRNGRFVRLWTAQLVSTIGDALTSLAAGIIVYERTQSALSVGLILMATAVPTLVFGLIAGVVVDRYDRKKIMIAADILRAAVVVTIPFLITASIVWLYVLVIVSASITQFFSPANESVLPEIASEEELGAANAIMAIAQFGSTAVGFAAAGFLASTNSIEAVFFVDAGTFLFSALMISLVKVDPLEVTEHAGIGSVIRDIGFGAKFIAKTPILRSLNLVRVPVLLCFGLQNVLLLAVRPAGPARHRVRVRAPGGADLGRLRHRQPGHGPPRRSAARGSMAGAELYGHGPHQPALFLSVLGLGGRLDHRRLRRHERSIVRGRPPHQPAQHPA